MKRKLLLSFTIITVVAHAQEKLKRAKEGMQKQESLELREENVTTSPEQENKNSYSGLLFNDFIIKLTLGLVYNVAIESFWETDGRMHNAKLQPYPFFGENKGEYDYERQKDNQFRVDLKFNYLNDFKSVKAIEFQPNLRIGNRLGIRLNYIHYWEDTEKLDAFYATLDYYRVRTPNFSMDWGIGMGFVANEVYRAGLLGRVGMQLNLRPFSIEADAKTMLIGPDVTVLTIGANYHYNNYKIGTHYQKQSLGFVELPLFGMGLGFYF